MKGCSDVGVPSREASVDYTTDTRAIPLSVTYLGKNEKTPHTHTHTILFPRIRTTQRV